MEGPVPAQQTCLPRPPVADVQHAEGRRYPLESGLTAWRFGPVASVVSGGIGTILVVLGVHWLFPQVRRFGSLREAREAREAENLSVRSLPHRCMACRDAL